MPPLKSETENIDIAHYQEPDVRAIENAIELLQIAKGKRDFNLRKKLSGAAIEVLREGYPANR
jgi:hypothetical protein